MPPALACLFCRSSMRVHLKGFTSTDAIVVIECECGNTRMLDEAGGFPAERIYVFRRGVPIKNLRCCRLHSLTSETLSSKVPECRERYRIILQHEHEFPYLEIEHISPRPNEQILEVETIKFPEPST